MKFAIGIDTGGTFTDIVAVGLDSAELWSAKISSTPEDPTVALLKGIELFLSENNQDISHIERVFHGTTLATNAILEKKGSITGLLTTRGFRHVLEIGRHDAPRDKNIFGWVKPKRPIPPWMIAEVSERIDASGKVLRKLDEEDCRQAIETLIAQGAEAIAICFLHSYNNDVHEHRAAEIGNSVAPDIRTIISSQVTAAFREYERTMATVMNAYLLPKVGAHIQRIEDRLKNAKYNGPLFVMKSNGGVASAKGAASQPAHLALSGPAAGVIGARHIGVSTGRNRLISIDVGGTSADICLLKDGNVALTRESQVGDFPLNLPMLDIHTIGAGGGSIAEVSRTGALTVGPHSAGADPGPACYGKGGAQPTATDANLVLGRIPPTLIGGEIQLDTEAAKHAIKKKIAEPLGLTVESTAEGIVEILDNVMAGAVRVVSIEKGHDPRNFALVALGGAGPLHSGRLSQLLDIPEIIIPQAPGVVAALGLLVTDLQNDYVRTCLQKPPEYDIEAIDRIYRELDDEAHRWLQLEQVPTDSRKIERHADLRYANQGFELSVDCPDGTFTHEFMEVLIDRFHQHHKQLYTYAAEDAPVELVNLRVRGIGRIQIPETVNVKSGRGAETALSGERSVWFRETDGFTDCPIYNRSLLGSGDQLAGPCIIEQPDSTAVLLSGQTAIVHASGSLIVTNPQ